SLARQCPPMTPPPAASDPGRNPRVLIAAGGTAGHVVPSLAVAAELTARGADVVFAGTAERIESRLGPAPGHPLHTYPLPCIHPPPPAPPAGLRSASSAASAWRPSPRRPAPASSAVSARTSSSAAADTWPGRCWRRPRACASRRR